MLNKMAEEHTTPKKPKNKVEEAVENIDKIVEGNRNR